MAQEGSKCFCGGWLEFQENHDDDTFQNIAAGIHKQHNISTSFTTKQLNSPFHWQGNRTMCQSH